MPPRKVTRLSAASWLIGCETPKICGENKLPTLRSVLQYVLHLHKPPAVTIREACALAVDDLLPFWTKGGVPTVGKKCVVDKLIKIHGEWVELKRSMKRPTNARRERFISSLDRLFDIGLTDAEKYIEVPEDRAFYKSMKDDRKATIASVDKKWVKKKTAKLKRIQGQERLKRRSDEETKFLLPKKASVLAEDCSDDPDSSQKPATEDPEYAVPVRKRKKFDVLTNSVTAAIDRTQTSDRFASHILSKTVTSTLSAAASALGVEDVSGLTASCSTTTIWRRRRSNRANIVAGIKESLSSEPGPFLLHWDGKLLPEGDGGKKYDRLPVLVTSIDREQLLGVPRLDSGTGLAEAYASHQLVVDWGIQDKICGFVFDTTSTNTGCIKGCCTLLQEMMGKEILHCACRHHVDELILEAVTTDLLGESNDPRLPFFAKLDSAWPEIDKAKYRTAASTRKLKLIPEADEIITFCRRQLEIRHPRGDYREFLELVILFLGGVVSAETVYSFKKPGALSKTRWMMRAIYSLKTWMFGRQLKLTASQDSKLFALNVFVSRVYIRKWFRAPLAPQAPRNDLLFLQALYIHKGLGSHWRAALKKFANHLWYLSAKLVCLALFDDEVLLQEKKDMVEALHNRDGEADPPVRAEVSLDDSVLQLRLVDFVSKNSMQFFNATGISSSFLAKDPVLWRADDTFQRGLKIVTNLKVVNDAAERAVQLVTKFMKGNKLTLDEEQRQLLLLTVADDRKQNKL